jgi:hypothetical protein
MPTDKLRWYLSGGDANGDPNASLGGPRSRTEAPAGLFDAVTGDESAEGATEYRLVYFRNEGNILYDPVVWFLANTPSDHTVQAIGLATEGKNGMVYPIADVKAAPLGVRFSSPPSRAAGLALASAPYEEGEYIGVWVRRIVKPGATSALSDPSVLRVQGDTI